MLAFLSSHLALILSVLLGLSEVLALLCPPASGVAGLLQGLVKALKLLGAKEPSEPAA